jgi:phosphoglucomutase
VVGGEESYGYLAGDFVRDKDAIGSACLLAEAAAYHAAQGSSFYRALLDLYARHGVQEIQAIMSRLRTSAPSDVAGFAVAEVLDYQSQSRTTVATGAKTPIALPKSNVIQLVLANGDRITARPSGTEPKIKYYFNVVGSHLDEANRAAQYRRLRSELAARVEAYRSALKKY